MYKAIILPLATKDIRDTATWYESRQNGLGKRFVRLIRKKVKSISSNPHLFAVRYYLVRTAVVDVFPFMIHFTVNEESELVLITAVLHTSQNPDKWMRPKQ